MDQLHTCNAFLFRQFTILQTITNITNAMIKKLISLLSLGIIVIGLTACDKQTEPEALKASEAISILNPHIRAMPPGQKVTAMYFQLKNSSSSNHDLIKVEGDISNMIELHTHTNNNGVMQMGEVESIPVAANDMVEAKPGSYHVMIMGLKQDLSLGDKFDFNLTFKDGSSKSITAEVKTLKLD